MRERTRRAVLAPASIVSPSPLGVDEALPSDHDDPSHAPLDVYVAGSTSFSMLELLARPARHAKHSYVLGQTLRLWEGSRVDGVVLVVSLQVAAQTAALIDEQMFLLGALGGAPLVVVMDGCAGIHRETLDDIELGLRERLEFLGVPANGVAVVRTAADAVLRGNEPWASAFRELHEVMDRSFLPGEPGGRDRLILSSSVSPFVRQGARKASRTLAKTADGKPWIHGQVIQGSIAVGDRVDLLVGQRTHASHVLRLEGVDHKPVARGTRGQWITAILSSAPRHTSGAQGLALTEPGLLRSYDPLRVRVTHSWHREKGESAPRYTRGELVTLTAPPGCLPQPITRVMSVDTIGTEVVLTLEHAPSFPGARAEPSFDRGVTPLVVDTLDPCGPVILRGDLISVARIIQ